MENIHSGEYYQQIEKSVGESYPQHDMQQLLPFTRKMFDLMPEEEYLDTPLKDLTGLVGSLWDFFRHFDGDQPKIRVFNATLEEDGWLSTHSVVYILQKDMPFLVDSLRIELNNRGLNIHVNKSMVFDVKRDADNNLVTPVFDTADGEATGREALMVFFIDRHSSDEELAWVSEGLREVLAEVRVVVKDFHPMLDRTEALIEETAQIKSKASLEEREQAVELLKWLHSGYYTFLGCCEYAVTTENGEKVMTELEDRRLGLFALHRSGLQTSATLQSLNPGVQDFYNSDRLLGFTLSSMRSRVHRNIHADYIIVKRLDKKGQAIGEVRLLGMFTSPVYTMSPTLIPVLRNKVQRVFQRSGLPPESHDGKALLQLLYVHPRGELFQCTDEQLYNTIIGIWQLNERRKVRFFMRPDTYGRFVNCMLYIPRDLYNTNVRQRVEKMLSEELGATEREFYTYLSESVLARIQFIFRVDSDRYKQLDPAVLEQRIVQIARNWNDELRNAVLDHWGEDRGQRLCRQYGGGFSVSYQANFDPRAALSDIELMESLRGGEQIAMSFYQPLSVAQRRYAL